MSTDRCEWSDLRRRECDHCTPGEHSAIVLEPPAGEDRRPRLDLFSYTPDPLGTDKPPLKLGTGGDNLCACGQPTRDHAYACDDCGDELARILGDVPWLAEQLHLTETRQRAKTPGSGGAGDGVPWHEKASNILAALRNELVNTIRVCDDDGVRTSSPSDAWPADNIPAMSRWLLWRVDGYTLHEGFTETLRTLLRVEANALHAIDRAADRKFLGWCNECGIGAVYAHGDAATGRCVEHGCGAEYDTASARAALEDALDDRLCTAAEIAKLATYLGLPAGRERVRNLVNQWNRRGRVVAHVGEDEPRFRYGDVRVLLAATYSRDEEMGACRT